MVCTWGIFRGCTVHIRGMYMRYTPRMCSVRSQYVHACIFRQHTVHEHAYIFRECAIYVHRMYMHVYTKNIPCTYVRYVHVCMYILITCNARTCYVYACIYLKCTMDVSNMNMQNTYMVCNMHVYSFNALCT